jgi:putative membrane protein
MNTQEALVKKLDRLAWVVSVVVLAAVVLMRQVKIETGIDFSFLPPFHASVNALVFITLINAYRAIRRKDIGTHRWWMTVSMVLSVVFLLSYVVYHITTPETRYGGEGFMRTVYFILLISHVVLAAIILPFILFTFIRGYAGLVDRHKRLARWVFPIWLYVAATGPICYLMLKPYYA